MKTCFTIKVSINTFSVPRGSDNRIGIILSIILISAIKHRNIFYRSKRLKKINKHFNKFFLTNLTIF